MIIDEWIGWRWECFHCGYVGRIAPNEEREQQRDEAEAYWKQKKQNG
jgi:Zn ribbon nucleic-acid-binding protein